MIMYFERAATQTYLENEIGCNEPEKFLDYQDRLENFQFTLQQERDFSSCIEVDIQGFFERHCLTLIQAVKELEDGSRLWPMVKLYYSVFYAVRVELYLAGLAIIRCKKIYTASGRSQSKITRFNNNEKGDHGLAFELMRKKIGQYDVLQTQNILDENVYLWIKNLREICQYKMRRPVELTNNDPFFDPSSMSFHGQVEMFLDDKLPIFCFDSDYAALALPITRFKLTIKNIRNNNIKLSKEFLKLAEYNAKKSESASLIFSYLK